jgi:hypothetical protein
MVNPISSSLWRISSAAAYGKGVLHVIVHLAHTTPSSLKMGNKTKLLKLVFSKDNPLWRGRVG